VAVHHIQIWVPDLGRAERSWGWLLDQLGFVLSRTWEHGRVWRKDGTGIAIEQSPDMVPGMLYSRLRPGLNHIAFEVTSSAELARLVDRGAPYGWTPLDGGRHPFPPGTTTAFIEDVDGFEIELVAPEAGPA
jgi:catechol 2,3-dioxygenase-like lactoylglutathione lyase family enzyme